MNANGPDDGDERDAKVDAAWRELPDASPPPELDNSIRAAARRAVHAKPAGPKARAPWPRWMTFAAAASIGVVAIGVWRMMPQEPNALHASASDVPVASRPTEPDASSASRQSPAAAPASPSAPTQLAKAASDSAAGVVAPVAAPPAAPYAPTPVSANVAPATVARADSNLSPPPSANGVANAPPSAPGFVASPPPASLPAPPTIDAAKPATSDTAKRAAEVAPSPAPFPGAARSAPAIAGRAEAQSGAAQTAGAAGPVDAKTAADAVAAAPLAGSVAAPAGGTVSADKAARSFDDFILAIRRALDAKHDDEAVKELQALRTAYPDADERMPVDLRSWAFRIRK